MKPKLLLGLALVLSGGLLGCSTNSNDWRAKAAKVSVGMTRSEVREILPMWDGPKNEAGFGAPCVTTTTGSGTAECYWVSDCWRVVVCFDSIGGSQSVSNRVSRPVKVYKTKYGTNWTMHEP